jgi:hypothetical protein
MLPPDFNSMKIISECPVCKKKHFPADIKFVEEKDEGHLLHVRCRSCQGKVLIYVMMSDQGANIFGILTDLDSDEVSDVIVRGSISADDVLDFHQSIKNNNFIKEIIK